MAVYNPDDPFSDGWSTQRAGKSPTYPVPTDPSSTYSAGELGYSERVTNFTTTNTTFQSVAAASKVGGLSVTVVGTGKPVDVEFFCGLASHTVTDAAVVATLITNGVSNDANGQAAVSYRRVATTLGTLSLRRRLLLADGVSYTFEVGINGETAGTVTLLGGASFPITLAVTER